MPKPVLGAEHPAFECIPPRALRFIAEAFAVGARKYGGAMNWRTGGIAASEYYAKALRHLTAWYEGEECAPDDGHHHLAAAAADIIIMIDAMLGEVLHDDRPDAATGGKQ